VHCATALKNLQFLVALIALLGFTNSQMISTEKQAVGDFRWFQIFNIASVLHYLY